MDSLWLDFIALVKREWFSGIWIVQEVVVAKSVTVWCGPYRIDWMDFHYSAMFILNHQDLIRGYAAPSCLKDHDAEKARFWDTFSPAHWLFRAINNINAVGDLASHQGLRRVARELTNSFMERIHPGVDMGLPDRVTWGK